MGKFSLKVLKINMSQSEKRGYVLPICVICTLHTSTIKEHSLVVGCGAIVGACRRSYHNTQTILLFLRH